MLGIFIGVGCVHSFYYCLRRRRRRRREAVVVVGMGWARVGRQRDIHIQNIAYPQVSKDQGRCMSTLQISISDFLSCWLFFFFSGFGEIMELFIMNILVIFGFVILL